MHIPRIASILPIIVLLAVTRAEWQEFNGVNDAEVDELNLVAEHLIPAEHARAKGNKASQGNIASVNQVTKQTTSHKTDLQIKDLEKQDKSPSEALLTSTATSKVPNNVSNVKKQALKAAKAGSKAAVYKVTTLPKTLDIHDDIDIQNEGFLLVEDVKISRTSRKLAQFFELFSEDSQESFENEKENDDQTNLSEDNLINDNLIKDNLINDNLIKHQYIVDEEKHPFVDMAERTQTLAETHPDLEEEKVDVDYTESSSHEEKTLINNLDRSMELACIEDTSWECQMFREDYMAMKNMSSRTSAKERFKRQAATGRGSTRASPNMSLVLDCEHGDCYSGNGTDPNEEFVDPLFCFGSTAKFLTNKAKLDDKTQDIIANYTMQQLTDIFKGVPGFKNVTVVANKIIRTTDGELHIPWKVFIYGGVFPDKDGKGVRAEIEDALIRAQGPYKTNFKIDGETPRDDFSATDAANRVEKQANDPCKSDCNPQGPCSIGFGSCERMPSSYSGSELKCTENCHGYPSCGSHGVCAKDMVGQAYCNCSVKWTGLYCDRPNDTMAPPFVITKPPFVFTSGSRFNNTKKLKPSDLTPEMRAEIARNMTTQLTAVFKNLPGFQNLTVDPNSISIDENGKLVVKWSVDLDPSSFSGKNPEQIGDAVREALLNVEGTYRNSVNISGEKPIEDFDADDAADQIKQQAENPCITEPCAPGYGHCLVQELDPITVKCIHNCNAKPVCQNNGTCQIDSVGSANCQCPSDWTGQSCEKRNDQLDGGQITGIVLGVVLLAAGLIGTCCWFLACRKGQRDVEFTDYADEEGTSSFSNASSKLCVIDRPHVRTEADPVFASAPYASPPASMTASSSNNGS